MKAVKFALESNTPVSLTGKVIDGASKSSREARGWQLAKYALLYSSVVVSCLPTVSSAQPKPAQAGKKLEVNGFFPKGFALPDGDFNFNNDPVDNGPENGAGGGDSPTLPLPGGFDSSMLPDMSPATQQEWALTYSGAGRPIGGAVTQEDKAYVSGAMLAAGKAAKLAGRPGVVSMDNTKAEYNVDCTDPRPGTTCGSLEVPDVGDDSDTDDGSGPDNETPTDSVTPDLGPVPENPFGFDNSNGVSTGPGTCTGATCGNSIDFGSGGGGPSTGTTNNVPVEYGEQPGVPGGATEYFPPPQAEPAPAVPPAGAVLPPGGQTSNLFPVGGNLTVNPPSGGAITNGFGAHHDSDDDDDDDDDKPAATPTVEATPTFGWNQITTRPATRDLNPTPAPAAQSVATPAPSPAAAPAVEKTSDLSIKGIAQMLGLS